MGPGENATPDDNEMAFELGKAIAKRRLDNPYRWPQLWCYGGCHERRPRCQWPHHPGVLPDGTDQHASENADIRIVTGMGTARNSINVLSSHIIVVLGMAAGTASAVAHAIKSNKKVILLNQDEITIRFFKNIGTSSRHDR